MTIVQIGCDIGSATNCCTRRGNNITVEGGNLWHQCQSAIRAAMELAQRRGWILSAKEDCEREWSCPPCAIEAKARGEHA